MQAVLYDGEIYVRYRTQRVQAGDENAFRRASLDRTQEATGDRGTEEHTLVILMGKEQSNYIVFK